MPTVPSALSIVPILPEVILLATALIVLIVDTIVGDKRWLPWVGLAGVAAAGAATLFVAQQPPQTFQGMAVADGYTAFFRLIILTASALGLLVASNWLDAHGEQQGEYISLFLLAAIGMTLMAAATHLMLVFIALELLSLSLYILAGFERERASSSEAALKYLLLGAFSSAFFLYGVALVYASTGALDFAGIAQAARVTPLLLIGIALLIVGFGFKVAAVPFHMWTPDVYQGAPTPITAFMSVTTKAAAFAAFLRVFAGTLGNERAVWMPAVAVLAALTMVVGNLAALRQVSLKRLLAYSSIAHAGYVLVGVAAANRSGAAAVLFYLFVYAFLNLGAFAVLIALEQRGAGDVVANQARGLARSHPWLAAAMAIFLFGLTGAPPLAGFFGKLYLFQAAVEANLTWLAIVGVINSAISAYFYLRIVVLMYMSDQEEATATLAERPVLALATAIAAIFVVAIGLYPGFWLGLAQRGVQAVLG